MMEETKDENWKTKSRLSDDFKEFLRLFKDESGFKYVDRIVNCIKTNQTIEINDKDLTKKIDDLFTNLTERETKKIVSRVVREIFQNDVGYSITRNAVKEDRIKIKFKGMIFGKTRTEIESKKDLKILWIELKQTKDFEKLKTIRQQINEIEEDAGFEIHNFDGEDGIQDTKVEILYKFLKSNVKKTVVSDENNSEVYAVIQNNKHCETIDLDTSRARNWLAKIFYDENKIICADESYKQTLFQLKAQAIFGDGNKEIIYNRIAQLDNCIWYDLTNPKWQAIKITKDSISIEQLDEKSPVFSRMQHQAEQIMPNLGVKRDALGEFVKLLQIPDELRLLFKIDLITKFLPKYATPASIVLGESGALKTTTTASMKWIVDPSGHDKDSNVSNMPKNNDDRTLLVYNRYMTVLENVSYLNQDDSDDLAKYVTGLTYSKRKHYENKDEVILRFKRKIALNGIAPSIEQSDLLQRCIFYYLHEISDDVRITDKEYEKQFKKLLPDILGQIFNILQKALQIYNEIDKEVEPKRMADFTVWGEAISRILGYKKLEFIKEYENNLEQNFLDAGDSHPIIGFLEEIVKEITTNCGYGASSEIITKKETHDKHPVFYVTVSNFHEELKSYGRTHGYDVGAKYSKFPKHSNKLIGYLKKIKQILKANHYHVEVFKYTKSDEKFPHNRKVLQILKYDEKEWLDQFLKSNSAEL